jgi:hypothetical protein
MNASIALILTTAVTISTIIYTFYSIQFVADDSGRRRDLAPSDCQQSVGGTAPLYRALTGGERS